jgi:hypothetical protein
MQRYAVLCDLDSPDFRRVGLAVERRDRVNLVFAEDYGIRTEIREPYTVSEPDGSDVVYMPGQPEYFDHVVLTLSRTFFVTGLREVEELNTIEMMRAFHDEVVSKQPRQAAGLYPSRPPLRILPGRSVAQRRAEHPRRRRTRTAFNAAA